MRFLVFQHVDVEHPGLLRDLWRDAGIVHDTVAFNAGATIPDPQGYDALVVMGGPMDVWEEAAYPWLKAEKVAIREWVRVLRRPYLGICLGHQLLADALGGSVGPSSVSEVGHFDVSLTEEGLADPIFEGFPERFGVFQWHSAAVDALPDGARLLAKSTLCPVQAFAIGSHAYGLQYHCEITAGTVGDWSAIPVYRQSLEATLGPGSAEDLARDTALRLPMLGASARRFNANFLNVVQQHRETAD